MKILIYGSYGWIGKQFQKILKKSEICYENGKSRVDNDEDLINEINVINPTHIVSFVGRTSGIIGNKNYQSIDYLEQKGKMHENIRDNLYSPLLMASYCQQKNIHFTYLGTGCIFTYDLEHPDGFDEESKPNFFGSSYSIVKGFTDRLMHLYSNVLNLRIRMPITGKKHERNFITKIVNYEHVCSILNSMSVLPELLTYVLDMIKNNVTGTINLTNPGLISHNEILNMYKEIVDPTFEWKNFTQEEQRKILDAERSNNFLNTKKIELLYPQINDIKTAVRKCLIEYKNNLDKENNLLITGGCGFIGSNFINKYFNNKQFKKIINIDAMYYCANENNVDECIRKHKNYKLIVGNICDYDLMKNILKKYNITHIIHFAAQSHVQNSFENSLQYTQDNIYGTHILLDNCKKYNKIKKIIHVSTDEVYGESIDEQKTEKSLLCPTNPYAATKASAEMIMKSYYYSYKLPIIITRSNNVYGKNQYPEKVIPLFIKLLKENKKITIHGNGTTIRSFIYIDDVVKAFELILEKGIIGEIYNIGSTNEYSVLDIAKILIKLIKNTDNYEEWIEYVQDRPFNDKRYFICDKKIKLLGWTHNIDMLTGLNNII
jgi:dTDP-glucose 4,6-dehydratase